LIATLDGSRTSRASYRFCSPEYFDALDIPLLSGRAFTEDEGRTGAPVAIVSESLAAELWSGTGATGRTIRITPVDTTIPVDVTTPGSAVFRFPVVEVVGVARNVTNGIESGGVAPPAVYLPASVHSPGLALLVRVVGEPESARRAIDRAIADQEPRAVEAFYLMRELLALRSYPFKVFSLVSVSVGLLALLLAMSGIYGVLSYIVTQRTKEIGLRMALGATARSVHRLVVGQLARLAVWGLLVGSVFALALSRVLASVLALVEPFDAVAYGVSLAVLFATCLAAAYLPAARAAGIDPANTLRHD